MNGDKSDTPDQHISFLQKFKSRRVAIIAAVILLMLGIGIIIAHFALPSGIGGLFSRGSRGIAAPNIVGVWETERQGQVSMRFAFAEDGTGRLNQLVHEEDYVWEPWDESTFEWSVLNDGSIRIVHEEASPSFRIAFEDGGSILWLVDSRSDYYSRFERADGVYTDSLVGTWLPNPNEDWLTDSMYRFDENGDAITSYSWSWTDVDGQVNRGVHEEFFTWRVDGDILFFANVWFASFVEDYNNGYYVVLSVQGTDVDMHRQDIAVYMHE